MVDRVDARERRKHPRISPKGTVVIYAREHVQRGRVSNLGAGGMLVMTSVAVPWLTLDESIDVRLRLDGGAAQWSNVAARVVRLTEGSVAMAFEEVSPLLLQEIEEMSSSSRAHRRVMNVVLIDSDPLRRAQMVDAFGVAGCMVVEAATSLEAIVRLGESMFEPDLVAIGDSVPSNTSQELRTFVEREHPRAKLVAIGNETIEPVGSGHWLSSTNEAADLVSRVSEMLGRPRRSR